MHSDRLSATDALGENPAPSPVQGSAPHLRTNQYAQLKRLIKQNGLLDRQPAYYAGKTVFTLGLLAVSMALLFVLGDAWFQLLNAAYLAFVFVQISLLSHDFGHRQFTLYSSRNNDWLTLIFGNFLLGLSRQWWIDKHNEHHGHPNQTDLDPDVDIPLLAFEEEQALDKRGLARFVVKYQAALIFPLSILQGLSMHRSSIQFLIEKRAKSKEHVGRSALHGSTLRGVLRLAVLGARTFAGAALHRRPSRALRHLHGLDLRTQPQSYAPPGTPQQGGLPAPASTDQPQRYRPPDHRLLVRRPQLPDRTSPVPEVTPQQAARSAADHQRLLPGSLYRLPRYQRAPVLQRDPAASSRGWRTAARSKKGEVTVLQIRRT